MLELLEEMINIGTLSAFVLVSIRRAGAAQKASRRRWLPRAFYCLCCQCSRPCCAFI